MLCIQKFLSYNLYTILEGDFIPRSALTINKRKEGITGFRDFPEQKKRRRTSSESDLSSRFALFNINTSSTRLVERARAFPPHQFCHYIVGATVTGNNVRRCNLIHRQSRTLLRSSVSRGAPLFIVLEIVYFAITTLFAASRQRNGESFGLGLQPGRGRG